MQTLKVLSGEASCCPGADSAAARSLAELSQRLVRALNLLEREQVCCGDVTVQQCFTLCLLRQEGSKTMQQMAEALGLAVSTLTRNVDVLERRGQVVRERGAEDARVVRVSLTAEGAALAGKLLATELDCCGQLLELVPAERRDALLTALGDLIQASEQLRARGCCR